jgi:hypothetical protein
MDMGFHLVYNLSWAVFGEGYTLKHEWVWLWDIVGYAIDR